ncbi:MAG TPA: hypothetical protein PK018_11320, partial [Candidatus Competibacter sp.]|nr:hypothetical protein [Candidatus Competibacter sp.]
HFLIARFQAAPLMISKLNTLLQLTLVLAVVANHGIMSLPTWLLETLIGLTALTTIWSGVAYVGYWGRSAWHQRHHPSNRPPPSP